MQHLGPLRKSASMSLNKTSMPYYTVVLTLFELVQRLRKLSLKFGEL